MWNSAQQRGYRDAEYRDAERHDKLKKSGRTAIYRRNASLPTRWLRDKMYINGAVLDYGCGMGADVQYLKQFSYDVEGYDPNHRPDVSPLTDRYDTVLCNYVLNVVQEDEVAVIIGKVGRLLKQGGTAYFTVRRDIKKEGYTKRDTYQRNVVLGLPIVKETSTYCIYKLEG